ncbi:MAG: response regulator [Candidatus Desulfatibia sp.]|uniref:response regulator n=1 Tax=Candidatus Desulfatibia sp. TaxID=3101189 RepID=UPI002F30E49C
MAFNVLIVDDSLSMRSVIKKTIRVSGFKVGEYFEAADGKEALKILADAWVDLVLTDINMPNMNGLELIAEMHDDQILRSIPVVMVTTEGSEKSVQKSMEMGAKGYIKKPFQPEDIKRMLNSIMGEAEDGESDDDQSDEGFDF